MDFEIVKGQILTAYNQERYSWSLKDFLQVFTVFYDRYRCEFGEDHPRLRTVTIGKVMKSLECDSNGTHYSAEDTLPLIDRYFSTELRCDYSIVHFVSGNIRAIREYELM